MKVELAKNKPKTKFALNCKIKKFLNNLNKMKTNHCLIN